MQTSLLTKPTRAYLCLTALVICGLAGSLITATKVVQIGISFPFSNVVFSIFTYPIVDCICELWGKQVARQTLWIGLGSQLLLMVIIQLSILAPGAGFWVLQREYQTILGTGLQVVIASVIAFTLSQILDIVVYQKIKELSHGKWLWLRSNVSTYLGQALDSFIFVNIVFFNSHNKWSILTGSILIKIILSCCMTPIVYGIVYFTHRYLNNQTLAFKARETEMALAKGKTMVDSAVATTSTV